MSPQKPTDWKQSVVSSCGCKECKQLFTFAADAEQTVFRLKARESIRTHLEHIIKTGQLEMGYQTDRTSNTHTLVCKKNRRLFQERCAEYAEDIAQKKILIPLFPSDHPIKAELNKAIEQTPSG